MLKAPWPIQGHLDNHKVYQRVKSELHLDSKKPAKAFSKDVKATFV